MSAIANRGLHLVDGETTLFWLRRDLRLSDNAGLYHALKQNEKVLPLFIFDVEILDKLEKKDARVQFIYETLQGMKRQLESIGSSILVLHGNPVELFDRITPKALYANHDYEPYARRRDDRVRSILESKGIPFHTFKDQVIFEKDEIVKDNREPYTVFTPYSRKWKRKFNDDTAKSFPSENHMKSLVSTRPLPMSTLGQLGFERVEMEFPPRIIRQRTIEHYARDRNIPGINGTTKISAHLRFGTVSIRKLVRIAFNKSEAWLNELIWREFFQMILWQFPRVETHPFRTEYENVQWKNSEVHFQAWCDGRTGYPMVDAGMRELNATGYMHNRVRMITADFLTKHLLIDWRWGEAYFAKKLLDFDLASNNGGWQWVAGCGCDATPYFRVFNPILQAEKFDPQRNYIRQWVPEVNSASYPKPIIDHRTSRERIIKLYARALTGN